MAQGVEQDAGALELAVVGDPDLGQRLVGRQLAGDAAGVHALHRGGDAGVGEQVGPQGGEGQVRGAGQSFHRRLWHDSAPDLLSCENAMTTSTTMSPTIRIDKAGGPEEMKLVDLPVGEPGPGEMRIRHHASGLNFIDVYQRPGVYPLPDAAARSAMEAAGVVEAVGAASRT